MALPLFCSLYASFAVKTRGSAFHLAAEKNIRYLIKIFTPIFVHFDNNTVSCKTAER